MTSLPIVENSQMTVKTAKMTTGVPIVTCLPRLYQPCTNSVSKTVKRQSKQQKSPLLYQESAEYTKSASASAYAEYTKPRRSQFDLGRVDAYI